jgi:hypothetical protein
MHGQNHIKFYTQFAGHVCTKISVPKYIQEVLNTMTARFIFINYASSELHKEENQ